MKEMLRENEFERTKRRSYENIDRKLKRKRRLERDWYARRVEKVKGNYVKGSGRR